MNKYETQEHLKKIICFLPPHLRDITIFYCDNCERPLEPEMYAVDVNALMKTCLYCNGHNISSVRTHIKT